MSTVAVFLAGMLNPLCKILRFRGGVLKLALVSFLLGTLGCTEAEVGSKRRPFAMYFVPAIDATKVAAPADEMTHYLSKFVSQALYGKDDGFYVTSQVPNSYIAVVEAFGTQKADFAAFNTFSYILAKDRKKYDVEAVLTIVRDGGEKTYKAQIIARADSGIKTLEDLNGKSFAFSDPASTSGYFLPQKLLNDKGIKLKNHVFAQKHDNVVTMVYQKQVDAGATFYSPPQEVEENGKKVMKLRDARARVLQQFPDVEEKVKIIGFSVDIPNEPWVIRSQLLKDATQNAKLKKAIIDGLLAFSKTESGHKALNELYQLKDLVPVSDSEYAEIRKIVADSSLDIQKTLTQK